jgi:hypothetical protein
MEIYLPFSSSLFTITHFPPDEDVFFTPRCERERDEIMMSFVLLDSSYDDGKCLNKLFLVFAVCLLKRKTFVTQCVFTHHGMRNFIDGNLLKAFC